MNWVWWIFIELKIFITVINFYDGFEFNHSNIHTWQCSINDKFSSQWWMFTTIKIFIKMMNFTTMMDFHHNDEFSSYEMSFHHNEEFKLSCATFITMTDFIILMNFHHYLCFYLNDEIWSLWYIIITVRNFH